MAYGHGKVILLGEHSVVHGRPALALSVARGAEVTFEQLPADGSRGEFTTLHIQPWGVDVDAGPVANEGREALQQALRVARGFYNDDLEVALTAQVSLPSGAGMGSSAALGVAVLRALDEARGTRSVDADIYERSLAWERVFHGQPSGIDNAMATYGGMALFQRDVATKRVELTPVAADKPRLVVGYSGSPRRAKEMISSVAEQYRADERGIGQLFDEIGSLVGQARSALEQRECKRLGPLMTRNHELLRQLGLSTDMLERMIARALEAGALGAKVTGAGGGGCMIALVCDECAPGSREAVSAALRELECPVYEV